MRDRDLSALPVAGRENWNPVTYQILAPLSRVTGEIRPAAPTAADQPRRQRTTTRDDIIVLRSPRRV